jgi:quercetin dioxygenase-like cupin family protein
MDSHYLDDAPVLEPFPGYRGRFVHSDTMTIAYWDVDAGADAPEHSHPHEQILSLIEGEFDLVVAGESESLKAGAVVVIPPNAPHSGRAVTACRIIDTFHPVREDLRSAA